jgi:hypothetical protein
MESTIIALNFSTHSHKNLPPNQFLKHIKTYLLNKIIYSFDEFLNNSSNVLK